jgi:hypothetical protein
MLSVTLSVQTNAAKPIGALADQLFATAERLSALKAKYGDKLPVPAEVAEMEHTESLVLKTRIVLEKLPD